MTDQHHPLTDEKARSLFSFERLLDMSQPLEIEDCMRTAADWQLEQVMEWLDERLTDYYDTEVWNCIDNLHRLRSDLKKAMRPTQEDNS